MQDKKAKSEKITNWRRRSETDLNEIGFRAASAGVGDKLNSMDLYRGQPIKSK